LANTKELMVAEANDSLAINGQFTFVAD